MGTPAVLVDDEGKPITRPCSADARKFCRHLDRHSKAVMKDFYRTSEFCSSCHKGCTAALSLNDYKWQRAISLYDEWPGFFVCESNRRCRGFTSRTRGLHLAYDVPHATRGTWISPIRVQRKASWHLHLSSWLWCRTPLFRSSTASTSRPGCIVQFLQNGVFNVDLFADGGSMAMANDSSGSRNNRFGAFGSCGFQRHSGRAADGRCGDPE